MYEKQQHDRPLCHTSGCFLFKLEVCWKKPELVFLKGACVDCNEENIIGNNFCFCN